MSEPVEKFRKDYKVPDFAIHSVDLTFKIYSSHTQVCFFSSGPILHLMDHIRFAR